MALDPQSALPVYPQLAPVAESQQMPVNIQAATSVTPPTAPTNKLNPLAGAGVGLTKIVLCMLSGTLLLLMATLIYQETRFSNLITDAFRSVIVMPLGNPHTGSEQLQGRQEWLKAFLDATNASRIFWKEMAQMILLNLLRPVLTALLGYVFGSQSSRH